jgi:hypothetical protein
MITGKDLEGWLTAENPQKAMAIALVQEEHRERRERIATAALAGMLANEERAGTFEAYAQDAVGVADALIVELDKKEEHKA